MIGQIKYERLPIVAMRISMISEQRDSTLNAVFCICFRAAVKQLLATNIERACANAEAESFVYMHSGLYMDMEQARHDEKLTRRPPRDP